MKLRPEQGKTGPAPTRRRLRVIAPAMALAVIATSAGASPMTEAPAATATRASWLTGEPLPCHSPGRSKPTVVLVHGAWADASSWNGEVEPCCKTRATPCGPSRIRCGTSPPTPRRRRLPEDRSTGPIVLVGHSYGGSVITNAAAGNPNVKALVYVDAAAPDVGETNGAAQRRGLGAQAEARRWLSDMVPYPGAPRER